MHVYRITGRKYANDLTGRGAAMFGGRWNKKGSPVLYTGENKEIALLETLVHTPSLLIPELDILTLDIPDNSITAIEITDLPKNWAVYPAPVILSEIGERWVRESKTIALKVPSCIIYSAHNYILNCRHPEYSKIRLIDQKRFKFDTRLIK
ncbi:MAG: RES family NAD+ phosphorylase [Bacteroidales bacterium]|jgi:RES domain-containing protein|nr:RES family NAD+ phosphorylase [Bacteroidales bacterium]